MSTFITLEGLDFSGKSTALSMIKNKLPSGSVLTREPGGTPTSEKIRDFLTKNSLELSGEQKLNLFFESRESHVKELIEPNLLQNNIVISDRYIGSTFAYQVGGDGLPFELVKHRTDELFNKYPLSKPDLTIYFQIPDDVRKKRFTLRSSDALDGYDSKFYERVEKAYLDGIRASSNKLIILDANNTPENVANKLLEIINNFVRSQSNGSN